MIDSSNIKQVSTAATSPLESRLLNVYPKIIGYIPYIEYYPYKLIPLRKILPISITLLNFILTNLLSIILEVIKRDLPTPDISLDKIMVNEIGYASGIPVIISKQDKTTAQQCEVNLMRYFSKLCQQLGCDFDLINCTSFNQFQDLLLLRIQFQQASLKANTELLLNYLQINNRREGYSSEFTEVYIIQTPNFFQKLQNEDNIAVKVSLVTQEIYELREIQIIEEFQNEHLPYLYGYLRYSDYIILFLKKHDFTFNHIAQELNKQKKDFKPGQVEQILLKLFRQMIKATNFIHSIDIIHRDLKPLNIMFDVQKPIERMIEILDIPVTCTLIDFDRSIRVDDFKPQKASHYVGTPFYRPPEGELNKYNPSYDVWQLGFMWLVIQKHFFHQDSIELQGFGSRQNEIQKINSLLVPLQDEMQCLNQKMINSVEKQNRKNELQNIIQNYTDQKRQLYIEFIQKIQEQENYFIYCNQLQNIIKKMIEFDPQNRATLNQVQAVIDSINK